jgi:hypothetical protein
MSSISGHLGQKHHYLPVFYLKRWAGRDRRLCEYSRPWNVVKPRMTSPSGTGYERDLYTIDGLPPETSQLLERRFMKAVDQGASDTLDKLLDGSDLSILNVDQKSAWSRFIMSLIQRNPEKISWITRAVTEHYDQRLAEVEATYDALHRSNDPPTFGEYKARMNPNARAMLKAKLLQTIVDLPTVGRAINEMIWGVATLNDLRPRFLTSDRPVVMTNGIGFEMSHIIMPISPRMLFVAVNTPSKLECLRQALREGTLLDHVNHTVAAQAQRFVYFCDDSQLPFIEDRLGLYPAQFIAPAQSALPSASTTTSKLPSMPATHCAVPRGGDRASKEAMTDE